MLDYAANAAHWTVDKLIGWLQTRCEADELDLDDVLLEHTADPDGFWESVRTNLAAGRMRLVFVADDVPPALRRIIEFLNGQMTECEVLGIEVRQYLDESRQQTIVAPRVLGQTEAARQVKRTHDGRRWDRESLLRDLQARCSPAAVRAAEQILEWGERQQLVAQYGKGTTSGSVQFGIREDDRRIFPFVVYSSGSVEFPFSRMHHRPFSDAALREQYRLRLNEIDGVDLPAEAVEKRPNVSLDVIAAGEGVSRLLAAADWALRQR